jgi:CBS domain-containing protein
MNIGELCTREVYIVNPGEPLSQAVHEMRKRNIGCVVVVERRGDRVVPVGVVTDRDIVRALPDYPEGIARARVADVMTREPLTLAEDSSIVEGMGRLRLRGVRRAPVTAANGDLVGIVSLDDCLGIVAEQLDSLVSVVERQTRPPPR